MCVYCMIVDFMLWILKILRVIAHEHLIAMLVFEFIYLQGKAVLPFIITL